MGILGDALRLLRHPTYALTVIGRHCGEARILAQLARGDRALGEYEPQARSTTRERPRRNNGDASNYEVVERSRAYGFGLLSGLSLRCSTQARPGARGPKRRS